MQLFTHSLERQLGILHAIVAQHQATLQTLSISTALVSWLQAWGFTLSAVCPTAESACFITCTDHGRLGLFLITITKYSDSQAWSFLLLDLSLWNGFVL